MSTLKVVQEASAAIEKIRADIKGYQEKGTPPPPSLLSALENNQRIVEQGVTNIPSPEELAAEEQQQHQPVNTQYATAAAPLVGVANQFMLDIPQNTVEYQQIKDQLIRQKQAEAQAQGLPPEEVLRYKYEEADIAAKNEYYRRLAERNDYDTLRRHLKQESRTYPLPYFAFRDPFVRDLNSRVAKRGDDHWQLFVEQQLRNDPHISDPYKAYVTGRKGPLGLIGRKTTEEERLKEVARSLAKNKEFKRDHQADIDRIQQQAREAELQRFAREHPEKNEQYRDYLSKQYGDAYRPSPSDAAKQAGERRAGTYQALESQYPPVSLPEQIAKPITGFIDFINDVKQNGLRNSILKRTKRLTKPKTPGAPSKSKLAKELIESFLKRYGLGIFLGSLFAIVIAVCLFLAINFLLGGSNKGSASTSATTNDCNGHYAPDLQSLPSHENFGDPNCEFVNDRPTAMNDLISLLKENDLNHWSTWFTMIGIETGQTYDPNSYNGNSTSGAGAYGLLQMNPSGQGINNLDTGNVDWRTQITNGVSFLQGMDAAKRQSIYVPGSLYNSCDYWASARPNKCFVL